MKQCYRIADHVICIECDNPDVIELIQGFEEFRSEYSEKCVLHVKLCANEPSPIEGIKFHSVETSIALCVLYHTGQGNGLEIRQNNILKLSLQYNMDTRHCIIIGCLAPELLRYALWLAYNFSVINLSTIAIHSSSIAYENNAFLYLGESGTGKSTHTKLLCQYLDNAELLNDDSPILRIINGNCFIYGSPWSGKTPCYKRKKALLTGITRLSQASENRIEPLTLHKAVGALLPSFPPELYLNSNLQHYVIDLMSCVLDSIMIHLFKCLPNKEAAEISISYIRKSRIHM